MSDAELKLEIIRLIDNQNSETIQTLYELILSRVESTKNEYKSVRDIAYGYEKMAQDEERENEAFEWIEGTLVHQSLNS